MRKTTKLSSAIGVAIRMEQEGQKFYTKAAERTRNELARRMFLSLASDEKRHEQIFRQLGEEAGVKPADEKKLGKIALLREMSKLFRQVGKKAMKVAKASDGDLAAIDVALGMEEKSYFYYVEAAKTLKPSSEKDVLLRIAEEENTHFHTLNDTRFYLTYPRMWHIMDEKPVIDGG